MRPAKRSLRGVASRSFGALKMRLLPLTGFPVSVLHETLPPRSQIPAVLHRRTREYVFVLSGRGEALIDGRRVPLRGGDILPIPAGAGHAFKTGARTLTALSLFYPALDRRRPDVSPAGAGAPPRFANPFRGKRRNP